jgi:hypothetical protein
MKKLILLSAVVCLTVVLSGCGNSSYFAARRNLENSAKLRTGMTKMEVIEVMGEPVSDEAYCRPDLWFYYIDPQWYDGLITMDECMPLVFKDGKLLGWGNEYYNQYYYASPNNR